LSTVFCRPVTSSLPMERVLGCGDLHARQKSPVRRNRRLAPFTAHPRRKGLAANRRSLGDGFGLSSFGPITRARAARGWARDHWCGPPQGRRALVSPCGPQRACHMGFEAGLRPPAAVNTDFPLARHPTRRSARAPRWVVRVSRASISVSSSSWWGPRCWSALLLRAAADRMSGRLAVGLAHASRLRAQPVRVSGSGGHRFEAVSEQASGTWRAPATCLVKDDHIAPWGLPRASAAGQRRDRRARHMDHAPRTNWKRARPNWACCGRASFTQRGQGRRETGNWRPLTPAPPTWAPRASPCRWRPAEKSVLTAAEGAARFEAHGKRVVVRKGNESTPSLGRPQ